MVNCQCHRACPQTDAPRGKEHNVANCRCRHRACNPPKISFAGVNKFYDDHRTRTATTLALGDFSLDMAPNEIVSIVGPTGCGNSTALNLLAGFEQPSSGLVIVDGQAVTDSGPNRGVVFQHS